MNDLSRGWIATSDDVRSAVGRVLSGGWYLLGPEHEAFEAELAAYVTSRHAIGVASGTDALALALRAIGGTRGSEIVTAANAGGYTSIAAAMIGADVVYADVDPRTLLLTTDSIEAVIGPSTVAVVVTHLYGNIAEMPPIVAMCRARGVAIVEDCAQAIGGSLDGRRAGTFGDVAALSFYPTKNLGAAGDGGAVVTNDDAIAGRVRALRQYGWEGRNRIASPGGVNSRLDELQAAILRIGLRQVDELTSSRQAIVQRYAAAARGSRMRIVTGASRASVAHLAVLRVTDRDAVRATFDGLGIATDVHYPIADHQQPGLAPPRRATMLPETELATGEVLTLPCFPAMTADEVDRVCSAIEVAAR